MDLPVLGVHLLRKGVDERAEQFVYPLLFGKQRSQPEPIILGHYLQDVRASPPRRVVDGLAESLWQLEDVEQQYRQLLRGVEVHWVLQNLTLLLLSVFFPRPWS